MRLQDKVAIVTGAGSGNGRGIALRLAEEGAAVVVADVNESGAHETAALIEAAGGQALVVRADVSRREQIEAMVQATLERFGQVDILVNNAGVESMRPFLELPEAEWDRVMGVNLKGPFLCTQAVAREMAEAGRGGKIVNIASICSAIALVGEAHYIASKGGLLMLTKAMALDLAPYNINVNAVGPGVIETAMTANSLSSPARVEMFFNHIPLKRIGQPRDIANAVLFLASDEADYVTGTILYVDGGWLAQ
ncbi:MAG: 3-oxoacyl-ACP reductase FabG [Anaerolineales bacterium]|nr:3-oxoacyl-ACP reductase FabG [Anaerolineales bacterium]